MKTIGLIGGMSWQSSVEYYRIINEEVREKLGGLHSAKCLMYSVDFDEIERFQMEGDWMKAGKLLGEAAKSLEFGGAELIVLCTNTMHKVADRMMEIINLPFLHIADATAEQIDKRGMRKVGLLGTKYTMEQNFYKSRIESNGLEMILPNENEREVVNRIIFEELCLGETSPTSKESYKRVIDRLIYEGAEGIILGCTEIGLLVDQKDSPVPIFDTTVIHAKAAVEEALKK